MNTDNLTLANKKSKCLARTAAIEAGQKDPDCRHLGFTLIKSSLVNGLYDYAPGRNNVLLSTDTPQAYYYRTMRGTWLHTVIGAKK